MVLVFWTQLEYRNLVICFFYGLKTKTGETVVVEDVEQLAF